MQAPQRLRDPRSGPRWLAVPVLFLVAWGLQAQDPGASQADLEQRVADLEARLLKAGNATRIVAPFEVIDAGGTVVLRVAQTKSTAAGVNIYHAGPSQTAITVNGGGKELAGMGALGQNAMVFVGDDQGPRAVVSGKGEVVVLDENENEVAYLAATENGGRVAVGTSADSGGAAVLEVDENGGLISISGSDGGEALALSIDSESGVGMLRIGDDSADVARLGGTKDNAGILSLSNSAGKPVINVTGALNNAGGVVIGDAQGLSVMEAGTDKEGAGMFRIFSKGSLPAVVLSRDGNGGLLQLSNMAGVNAANFQIGAGSSGYLQLTDGTGTGMVEAGGAPGYGIVRVGPVYDCSARPLKSPQCLVGKQQ
ncbi:MAG TPA: hypothetical protein VEB59_01240 [Gemmatimonadales bacterium]|nr:hypothetical protein [Gemmatimonadales bacterium]